MMRALPTTIAVIQAALAVAGEYFGSWRLAPESCLAAFEHPWEKEAAADVCGRGVRLMTQYGRMPQGRRHLPDGRHFIWRPLAPAIPASVARGIPKIRLPCQCPACNVYRM